RFERAAVIVSFDCDFLGTWLSPVEFTKAYVSGRTLEGVKATLSKHVQFEGRMSVTGSNADRRIEATPEECRRVLMKIAKKVAEKAGESAPAREDAALETGIDEAIIGEITNDLWKARGKSLVVCGLNDVACQRVVNFINHALGNYGKTLDIREPSF